MYRDPFHSKFLAVPVKGPSRGGCVVMFVLPETRGGGKGFLTVEEKKICQFNIFCVISDGRCQSICHICEF